MIGSRKVMKENLAQELFAEIFHKEEVAANVQIGK